MRHLVFGLTILTAICAIAGLLSCKRPRLKERHQARQTQEARNLTPGQSEELTALAGRHKSSWLMLAERPDKNEEAKNLAGLIAKAFEAGGWTVIRPPDVSASLIYGLQCTYNPKLHQKLAAHSPAQIHF